MAASHRASLSLAPKTFPNPPIPPFAIRSESGLPSLPVKQRKNYLRLKILKTLHKPYYPTSTPIIPIEPPPVQVQVPQPVEEKVNEEAGSSLQEFQVSEPGVVSIEERRSLGKLSPTTVLRYGFYFVVVFVLQKFFAVLFSGNGNPGQVTGGSDSLNRNSNKEIGRGKYYLLDKNDKAVITDSSDVLYWDEPELEKKIEEIRNMAREARKSEKNDDEDGDLSEESPKSGVRMDIEKKIGARLNNVEKSINSKLKIETEATKVDQPLLFKKKLKFKVHGRKTREEVKGFPGMKKSAPKSKNGFGRGLNPAENQDTLQGTGEKGKKTQKDLEAANGTTEHGPQLKLQNQERKWNKKPTTTSSSVAPEKPEGSSGSSSDVPSRDSQSESRKNGAKLPGNMVNKKQSGAGTDMWWLDLPYVLGILAHRALDDEKSEGFFTIRAEELSETSYMVAFEDHGDAKNFCYLLESYFEELGDFHTDIVPLSVQQLREAMKADGKKVVVVRKGQLKLYVGQPFDEVEAALRSLVEQI